MRVGRENLHRGRSGQYLGKLWKVLDALLAGEQLQERYHPYRPPGQWSGFWECHIEPDWALAWDRQPGTWHRSGPARIATSIKAQGFAQCDRG